MKRVYLLTFAMVAVSLGILMAVAQTAHGQNFAGTVVPQRNPEPPQQEDGIQGNTTNDPFPAESTDTAIPEFISAMSHYTLGAGDVLEIEVIRHPEVSGQYVINNEGNIQYEFVGDIPVADKTKDEVRDILAKQLSAYIISPEVTVKIAGYNSKIVYVIGEVGAPGKIFMRGDAITVHEALVQAGLPLLSAKTTAGRVITPAQDGQAMIRKVNIHKLLYDGDLRENLVMRPGDTLYVPPTFLAKTMRVLQPIAAPIGTAAGTGRTVTTGF
jgi:polysaccharide export outer membrane protein